MMKVVLSVCFFVLFVSPVVAELTSFSVVSSDTVYIGSGLAYVTSSCYNWATGHIIWADSGNDRLVVTDVDGSNPTVMNMTGVDKTGYTCFSVCCTPDGKIFAGSEIQGPDPVTEPPANVAIVFWANESAAPVEVQNVANMEFPRAMRAINDGDGKVRIAVTGGDRAKASIHTTPNGSSYTHVETMGEDGAQTGIKHGVDFGYTGDLLYGVKQTGIGAMSKYVRDATGDMVADLLYAPNQGSLGRACMLGYIPGHNALLTCGASDAPEGTVFLLDGDTGAVIDSQELTNANIALYGYGTISVNEDIGEAYMTAKGALTGQVVVVKMSFDLPGTPTPTNTPLPTNTPVSSGIGRYEIYD